MMNTYCRLELHAFALVGPSSAGLQSCCLLRIYAQSPKVIIYMEIIPRDGSWSIRIIIITTSSSSACMVYSMANTWMERSTIHPGFVCVWSWGREVFDESRESHHQQLIGLLWMGMNFTLRQVWLVCLLGMRGDWLELIFYDTTQC